MSSSPKNLSKLIQARYEPSLTLDAYTHRNLTHLQHLISTSEITQHRLTEILSFLKLKEYFLLNNYRTFNLIITDPSFYKTTLTQRLPILGAPTIYHLCKTLVLENTSYNQEFASKFYPKYVAVIIQWATKLNSDKMNKTLQKWQNENSDKKVSRKGFNFRSLQAEKCLEFTGYSFNAVTPVLFNRPMPVLVSDGIARLEPRCFFMGGGNVDTKLRIGYDEFVEKSEYVILEGDIANIRTDLEGEGGGSPDGEN